MIRIGETHAVCTPWDCREFGVHWAKNQDATEAVKRLVEAARDVAFARDIREINEHMSALIDAVALFTDLNVALVDSGLRSCATPETSAIKGDDHG